MLFTIFIIFIFLYLSFPFFRFIFSKDFFSVIHQFFLSTYEFFKYKEYNNCNDFGYIDCYCGLFGQGKTKQAVNRVTRIYKNYNNKKIWDGFNQKFVTQTIRVFSNVKLSAIPYYHLYSMQDMIDCIGSDYGVVNIFLIDEASVVFNSRDFKTNFNSLALNTILTSRHHRIGIILTSQRFNHLDALLRQVVSNVIQCEYIPFLHLQKEICYNAWDLECSKNPRLCRPRWFRYSYTSGYVYSLYDTYSLVNNIKKECVENKQLSDSEIIQNQGNNLSDTTLLNRPIKKRKGKR